MSATQPQISPDDLRRAERVAVGWSRACCQLVEALIAWPVLMVPMADAGALADDDVAINPDAVVVLRCGRAWTAQWEEMNVAGVAEGLIGDGLSRYRYAALHRFLAEELRRAGLWHEGEEALRRPDHWSVERLAAVSARAQTEPYLGEAAGAALVARVKVLARAAAGKGPHE